MRMVTFSGGPSPQSNINSPNRLPSAQAYFGAEKKTGPTQQKAQSGAEGSVFKKLGSGLKLGVKHAFNLDALKSDTKWAIGLAVATLIIPPPGIQLLTGLAVYAINMTVRFLEGIAQGYKNPSLAN